MTNIYSSISSRAPLQPLAGSSGGSGVTVSERDTLGLATVLARRGQSAALAERMRQRFHIELPRGAHRATAGDLALMATGPGAWLATHEQGWKNCAAPLRAIIGDLASISEQSDAYLVLRLSGPRIRDTLAKMVPVDFHPRAFMCGAVAVTAAGHMGATLWRLDDDASGDSVFEIAVYRSMATGFFNLFSDSAAEFTLAQSVAHCLDRSRAGVVA